MDKILQSLLFSRLSSPSSLSLLYKKCFILFIIFVAILYTQCSMVTSLVVGSPELDAVPRDISPALKEESPHSACWQHSAQHSPRGCLPSLPQRHIAGSCSTYSPPGLPGPFLQSCFPDGWPQPILLRKLFTSSYRTLQ